MNITTPEQMSSGTSNLEQTITKFEKNSPNAEKTKPSTALSLVEAIMTKFVI